MNIKKIDFSSKISLNFKTPSVLCVGYFDGFHLAHKELINNAKKIAKEKKLPLLIVTFSEKVRDYISGTNNSIEVNEYKFKKIISYSHADYIIEIKVNDELVDKNCDFFVDFLKNNLNAKYIVVGYNFKFGKNAIGDTNTLIENFGKDNVIIINEMKNISSTLIKESLKKAKIENVEKITGEKIMYILKKCTDNRYIVLNYKTILPNGSYNFEYNNISGNLIIKDGVIELPWNINYLKRLTIAIEK